MLHEVIPQSWEFRCFHRFVDVLCGSVVNLIIHWSIDTLFFAKLTLDKDDVAVF